MDLNGRLGEIAAWLKTDLGQAALAGAAGGAIRWITLREKPRDGLVSLLVGSICAIYAGPLVEPFLSPFVGRLTPGEDADGFAAFVVGIGGISLTGAVIDLFRGVSGRARAAVPPPFPPDPNVPRDEDFPGRPAGQQGGNHG
ncbi:hypothetical protein ACGYK5_17200 [Sulfitobacter sp. 1A16787]|uniref:hypothetical protein n=1 Tax=Sulfitobacter sp. 1A16787 TaxID=3368571 RepID=UPI0037463157